MKLLLVALLALTGAAMFLGTSESLQSGSVNMERFQQFAQWKAQNNKNYNGSDEMYRFAVFSANADYIEEFNAQQTGSLRLGLTVFADLTNEEFAEKFASGAFEEEQVGETQEFAINGDYPTTLDWVSKGAVTPVENQGQCGSCWAFSTKEALEGANFLANGNLQVFSAEQLTQCCKSSFGCNGGYQQSTWVYTSKNGIELESDYPYTSGNGVTGNCSYNASKVAFKNSSSKMVSPRNNQDAILAAVQQQPLSILVAASSITFQLYSQGVISTGCGTRTDHAILLTGYDMSDSSNQYWVVKNSWGTSWGQKGYANIAMAGNGAGTCGINTSVGYPIA